MLRPITSAGRKPGSATGSRRWALITLLLFGARLGRAAETADKVDFNLQIRPLLSDRCFPCHGPDETSRKAKLRLDLESGARRVLNADRGWPAFAPGHPEASEAWRRIVSADPDDQMPPPTSHRKLSQEEVGLVRRWIEQGAPYQRHWAFLPVAPVAVPPLARASGRNEIDAFVLDRLRREGWEPAPEAAPEALLRRLALDLTGLPPSLTELDEFLTDRSPEAYGKAVEHFLASPHYGERMAVDWLDLARYADTYGYQADVDRDLSPWRDWVIRAGNENLPYATFLLWQIAGDLLPGATQDQRLATVFNRLHRQTNEGGSIEEEFRNEYVADRVNTLGTAILGVTLECARCHDHKFDPIRQKDYYRLSAFFNRIDESGLYSHFTRATPTPALRLYAGDQQARHQELRRQIVTLEAALAARFLTAEIEGGVPPVVLPRPVAAFAFESIVSNLTANLINSNQPMSLHDGPELAAGPRGQALRFSGDNEAVSPGVGDFRRTDPFSFSLWLNPAEAHERAVVFHHSRSWTDSGSRGYELLIERGRLSAALIHFWPGNAIRVIAREPLPTNAWSHVVLTYDGSSRAAGLRLFVEGRRVPTETVRDHLDKDIRHRREWGDADVGNVPLTLAGRFRDAGFRAGRIDEFQVFDRCLTAAEARELHRQQAAPEIARLELTPEEQREHVLARHDESVQRMTAALQPLREAENNLLNDIRDIMAMEDLPAARPTFVLKRGAYDAPGEPVESGTPEGIMPFPDDLPRNRLGLAQWLIDRRQPLTARVVVNRIWRQHFGRGLVATPEDFGSQGRRPTQPALLDWLAGWFMDHGWDVKALHRLIVNSATYRQDSHGSRERTAQDPENTLLARGPSHRLSAEQIRDSALAVSGLLNPSLGGPSVKPYQPAGLWEEAGTGKTYAQDHGDPLYRRSLYTFWRRTAPPPSMLTFDATSREVCTTKRDTTTTPLQALVLLNDPQFVEAARVLGERLWQETHGETNRMIALAFRRATGREPTPREQQVLRRLYDEQFDQFSRHPDQAEQLLAVGEWKHDATLPAARIAAAAMLASAVFNHDEFVTQR